MEYIQCPVHQGGVRRNSPAQRGYKVEVAPGAHQPTRGSLARRLVRHLRPVQSRSVHSIDQDSDFSLLASLLLSHPFSLLVAKAVAALHTNTGTTSLLP